MKKKLLLFLMTLLWLSLAMMAEEVVIDGLKYELGYNNATLVGYEGEPTDLIIPSTVLNNDNEYKVVRIGDSAFSECMSLTSVVIPDGVTAIGNRTFYHCPSLESVRIPGSVISIGDYAFTSCKSFNSILIPEGVQSIGRWALQTCGVKTVILPSTIKYFGEEVLEDLTTIYNDDYRFVRLVYPKTLNIDGLSLYLAKFKYEEYKFNPGDGIVLDDHTVLTDNGKNLLVGPDIKGSYSIPEGVKSIGKMAFLKCGSLTSVDIPEEVTTIGESAFEYCLSLTSIVIPKGVATIEANTFCGCTSLATVDIPAGVTSIGSRAFTGCAFTSFMLDDGISCTKNAFPDKCTVLCDKGKTLFKAPNVSSFEIPEGVENIPASAFPNYFYWGGEHITTLTIPGSVRNVEADAFKYLQLERVNFIDWPQWYANVSLGNMYSNPYLSCEAYAGGVKITTPELKEGLTRIEDYINVGLDGFRDEVEIPSTVKRIGAYAFNNNKELYSVILPEGLEEIGESAFEGCSLLENPVFPESLKKIEKAAFKDCTTLTEINLPEGLNSLGEAISESDNVSTENYPGVFEGCTALEKAVIAGDIDKFPGKLFYNCAALNKVYFPTRLKVIGNSAFENCSALEEVVFPASLEEIGSNAFGIDGNGSIKRLVIPNSVKVIGERAFKDQSIENLTIGSGLEIIPEMAFYRNPLRVINFSEGLKEIRSEAFMGSEYSKGSVILPSTVTTLQENAFAYATISELVIPDKVTTLPAGSCGQPGVLTLGSGVKDIDANAFGFENLHVLRVKSNTPPTLSDAFPVTTDQNDNLTVIVNNGRRNNYVMNARWKQLDNIIEESSSDVIIYMTGDYALSEEIRTTTGLMPSTVTKMKVVGPLTSNDLRIISENMISLLSLDMSEVTNVTAIPDGMFSNSLITEIVLPKNLERIGERAFENCSLLKLSELPSTLKSIGNRSFSRCPLVMVSILPEALETIGEEAFTGCGIRELVSGVNLATIGDNAFSECTLLETVDLSASQLTTVRGFRDCTALDQILLPESATAIDGPAFSGTAIRDITFASNITEFGNGSFANCRRLVAANIPENTKSITWELFLNCPRLISVSFPSTTSEVAEKVVYNDKKLANISCANPEAPEAANGAFDNIRVRYVSLTVPTTSFRSYLNAPQWGKFQSIQNRIPVVIDQGVEVTNVAEDEYQDMVREDALEEAQEAAAEERNEEETEMSRRRVARRAAARAATPRQFAKLFDGAQIQTGSEGSGTRIFITPQEGVAVTSVKFNGEEMISKLEGNSLLLPAGSNGQLEIRTNATGNPTGVGMIYGDIDPEAEYDVYDLNGILIGHDMDSLERGIYIIRQGATVKKINVR
ncbi:MAG: leucine-rich repeat domain-containing protein [Muribaculaceae bacterium]|nr:leucine-rich repeat domain-containing protein [Muribaculaceae bacterium]